MSQELKTQFSSGATVYAVVLNTAGQAWRTDTHVFESPTSADWTHYSTACTEQSGTGIYEGNFPTAITSAGAYNVLFRQQSGGSPAASDSTNGMIGGAIFWTGTAESFPLASSGAGAANIAMSASAISSTPAAGSIDITTLTSNLSAVLLRNYLMTTGSTTPASADQWAVGGIYNNAVYYVSKATGLYAWSNGTGWTISSAVGTNGSAYWTTAGGASITGPYTAAGSASGTPTVVAHGNAILNAFQPDVAFPTNFASLGISSAGLVTANAAQLGGQSVQLDGNNLLKVDTTDWGGSAVGSMPGSGNVTVGGFASALVDDNGLLKVDTTAWGGSAAGPMPNSGNVIVGGFASGLADGNGFLKVDAAAWGGTAVGSMPGSGNVTVGGFSSSLVDGNGLLKVGVQDWNGTAVSLNDGLPNVTSNNVQGGAGPIAINQNTGGTDNLRYVDGDGNGVEGATILIYLATNWPSQPDEVEATAMTGSDGRWLAPAYVDSGTYVAVFTKIGADGPDVSPAFSV